MSAGHGHFEIYGVQTAAADLERCEIIFAGANVGAHLAQRADDALHGALLQRGITGQLRREFLTGEDAGEQAHGGSGIAGVESASHAFQTSQTMPGDVHGIFINFDFSAQRFHAIKRAVAIGGGGEMAQLAGPFGQGSNHGVTMGDGFVAGRLDAAGERFGWTYGALLHAGILAWGAASKNFTAEVAVCTALGEADLYVCTVLIAQQLATLRNFLSTLTYYLVQEKLYVSTRHRAPTCS